MTTRPNLFTRSDTLLGVCEGLGEETGIAPIVFRLGFAIPLIFAPFAVVAVYLAFGATLLIARRLVPTAVPEAQPLALPAPVITAPAAQNDDVTLARAA